jgi:hypothetical protein
MHLVRIVAARITSVILLVCLAYCSHAQGAPQMNSNDPLNVVLTVEGGVGAPATDGKWILDEEAKQSLAPERLNSILALIAKARAESVFGKDFSIQSVSGSSTDQAIRDAQTYTLTVDGDRAVWSEPPPSGVGPIPPVLNEIWRWMRANTKRRPYPLSDR